MPTTRKGFFRSPQLAAIEYFFDVAVNGFFQSFSLHLCHFTECRETFSLGFRKLLSFFVSIQRFPCNGTAKLLFQMFSSFVKALAVIVISFRLHLKRKCVFQAFCRRSETCNFIVSHFHNFQFSISRLLVCCAKGDFRSKPWETSNVLQLMKSHKRGVEYLNACIWFCGSFELKFASSDFEVILAGSKRETISVYFREQVYKFVAEVVKCAYRAVLIKYFSLQLSPCSSRVKEFQFILIESEVIIIVYAELAFACGGVENGLGL